MFIGGLNWETTEGMSIVNVPTNRGLECYTDKTQQNP